MPQGNGLPVKLNQEGRDVLGNSAAVMLFFDKADKEGSHTKPPQNNLRRYFERHRLSKNYDSLRGIPARVMPALDHLHN